MSQRLKILGTNHISQESVEKIRETIGEFKPDIVCVELDKKRLYALENNLESKVTWADRKRIGVAGFLFAKIGSSLQKKMGQKVGMKPGMDMLSAVKFARDKKLVVALIDQDIEKTLRNLKLGFFDIWHIFADMFMGLIMPKRQMKKYGLENMDISKVPPAEIVETMVSNMRHRYPGIYKALIHDRNVYMAKKINSMLEFYPDKKILVVVGAGHKDIIDLIYKDQL